MLNKKRNRKLYDKLKNNVHLDNVRDVYIQISEYDLKQHCPEAFENGAKLLMTLFSLGMDVSSDEYEEKHCTHRTLSRIEPYHGILYIAPERIDRLWLNSGNASFDVLVEVEGDLSLRHELNKIKTTSSNLIIKDVDTAREKCGYYSAATDGENYVSVAGVKG